MRTRRIVGMLATAAAGAMVTAMLTTAPSGAAEATPTVKMATPTFAVGSTLYQGTGGFEFGQAATEVFSWTITGSSSPVCTQTFNADEGEGGLNSTSIPSGTRHFQYQYVPDQYGTNNSVMVTFCNGIAITSNIVRPDYGVWDDSDTQDTSYFGAWSVSNCQCAIDGSSHYSTQKNASFSFRVAGSFGLVMDKASNRGSAAVYVDGKKTATINTYAKTAISSTFVYSALLSGTATHTVSVVNLATTGHPRIDFDAMTTVY